MASFDMVSLFASVPVDEALLAISQWQQQDNTLMIRDSTSISDLFAPVELRMPEVRLLLVQ